MSTTNAVAAVAASATVTAATAAAPTNATTTASTYNSNTNSSTTARRQYPVGADMYQLLEVIGRGVSSEVYRARCLVNASTSTVASPRGSSSNTATAPLLSNDESCGKSSNNNNDIHNRESSATDINEKHYNSDSVVAVKLLDLESANVRLEEVMREAQNMRMLSHHNVVELLSCFVHGRQLYMVLPFISGGSVLNIMKYQHPDGLDELTIATIVREVLLGMLRRIEQEWQH